MTAGAERFARIHFGVLVVAALLRAGVAHADPYLRWYTVRTPHFEVHYPGGLDEIAQRTASLAEALRERLGEPFAHAPSEVTHISVTDGTDSANGSATALPYNTIRLYVTAPEELSLLGDYDDWLLELVAHEQTHVFHLDNISGAAAILNAVVGKTYAPNQLQPLWILEGLAVVMESRLTGGGRLRSSIFDMYLRTDVLEHNLAGLDEMSHSVWRWPNDDIWYVYGGEFFGWILDTYGADVAGAIATDYGNNIIPWGLNRSVRRATGRTYPELYEGWVKSIGERYDAQAKAVRARGLRIGTRLTFGGRVASSPRFVPACAREGAREEILYHRDDGDRPGGFYRLPLASRTRAAEDDLELVSRTNGSPRVASFDGDCGVVFDSVAPSARRYAFEDLFHQSTRTGGDGSRKRWTTGERARSPDVSPDGRRVVFVTNHAGTSTLRIADILPQGGLGAVRRLVPSASFEQAFSPRFSPDGRRVAYSAWTAGGYRDVRVVDVESGAFFELSHDRALDVTPSFTPDGKYVLFSSDRTGIPNVFAYELGTGHLSQVTNVLSGAFMPELSPDGKTLVYVGYTKDGFDLYSLPFAETAFMTAPPATDDRPPPATEPPHVNWPVSAYDALETLAPRSYTLNYGTGTFGNALTARASGADVAQRHGIAASLTYNSGINEFTGSVGYAYDVLPSILSISGFRSVAPRAPLVVNGRVHALQDDALGLTTGLSYFLPGEFDGKSIAFSYTASSHSPSYVPRQVLDPYAVPLSPPSGEFVGSVRVALSYSSAFRPFYGISNERGVSLALSSDLAGRATGSDETLAAFDAHAAAYVPAPWGGHHVFALALSGGAAQGTFARRGYFFTGGFADTNTFDAVVSGLSQGAFVLRGYPPGAFVGRQYNLANLEYRFPIGWIDRGVSTLPFFLHGVSGALFGDYGGAFNEFDLSDPLSQYHLGVGGELRVSFTLGYFLDTGFRLGWAKGFGNTAVPGSQTYFVAAAEF